MALSKWQRSCKAAKLDRDLSGIAKAIVMANRAGKPDQTAYLAFQDKAMELGLYVPNKAYWTLLIAAAIGHYEG